MKDKDNDKSLSDRFLRKLMNTSPSLVRGDCRITIEMGKGLLIEGCTGMCDYSDEKVIVRTCSRSVVVEGRHLCICRMIENSIVICGQICSVSFA